MELTPLRGRGTAANIPNRFERLVYQPDPAERDPEEPDPRTVFFRDTTRTILTKNDSPDVGFTHSVNPYRGCEHGCVYCVAGDTRVLMGDGTTREIAALRPGDEIYGTEAGGWYARYAKTTVLAQWESRKVAYRVRLEDGTELVASGDHRFLTEQGWKHVTAPASERARPALSLGDTLVGFGRSGPPATLEGQPVESSDALRVVSMEPAGNSVRLFDITTGSGDFIANGVVSHNCFARPTHEWLGLSAGLDFETKIFVKEDAAELLREAIASKRWNGEPIALSGVTDPYQPIERKLRITRGCLEVLAEARNPVAMITKNHLITRDADLLGELASFGGAMVNVSITTLDPELQRVMEPRASTPARRLDAIRELTAAGIPAGVLVAPVIPGLTDHELPAILQAAADAGARCAGFVPLRLPYGLSDLFEQWLETHFPTRKEKVLHRVREIRGGKLNDPNFGSRMRGEGEYADQIRALFHVASRKAGLNQERVELSSAHFRRPSKGGQLGLF